jgi:hypothetical protein
MSNTCKDKQKFKTSEAATKSAMRTKGAINEFLKILDLPLFRRLNSQYSNYASEKYNIKERLFFEDGDRAVPNRGAFKQIDNIKGIHYQISEDTIQSEEEVIQPKATPEVIANMKKIAEKMNVSLQDLATYAKETGLDTKDVNGVADLMRGVIAIAEGKEEFTLTEEVVHIATAIIEQKNPKLVTEMVSKIANFTIYQRTFNEYKNNPAYQLSDGKPDIRKIKKEAVDKLITEVIVNQGEGSEYFPELASDENQSLIRKWWNAILDFFKGEYNNAGIPLFQEAAQAITEGTFEGTVNDLTDGGVFYQVTDAQKAIQDKINETKVSIEKVTDVKSNDPLLLDTEEANNYYAIRQPNGTLERITKRVTDRVKAWYKTRFPSKVFSEAEKTLNEAKRTYGVQGHADLEEIHGRYYNADGTKKLNPDQRPTFFNLPNADMYNKLEKYYTDLIADITKNDEPGRETLIFSEVVVYDQKNKEAGTIDFLSVDPDGKANILDWKFMDIKGEDVAWFKQGAFNLQISTYADILKNNYGIKSFGMKRAIPISMELKRENPKDPESNLYLSGIAIGSVNPSQIQDIKLIPISEETESTGYEALDEVIKRLNALLRQYSKEEATTEEEREFKIERLNTIRRAIRMAQGANNIAPLIDVIEVMRKDGERILEDYNTTYKNRPATIEDSSNSELSDFAEEMNHYIKYSEVFTNVAREIGDLIYSAQMVADAQTEEESIALKERKEVLNNLRQESDAIFKSREAILKAATAFADKHIGERNGTVGLTKPEAVIRGLASFFRGVSELPTRSLRLLHKLTQSAQIKAMAESTAEVKEIMDIREILVKKGGDVRKYVQQIYQKTAEGGLVNRLIHRYSKEFTSTVDKLAEEGGDKEWLLNNIDVAAYKEEAYKIMESQIEKIKKNNYPGTEKEVESQKEKYITEVERLWDIEREDFNGFNNYVIKRHPLDKWYSEEYKKVLADPDLKKLYDFIVNFNKKATDVGYINNMVTKTFLPFIRKEMAEEIAFDNTISPMKNFADSLRIKTEDVGYGRVNEVTGELENGIPKYYTYDFTKTEEEGVNDFSDVSEDIFKNLILYVQQVNKYKYLTEVEGQLKLIKTIEEFKGHLNTNRINRVVTKDGKPEVLPGNEKNAKMYDDFLNILLYGQKYADDSDKAIDVNAALNFVKRGVNSVAGREVWKETEGDPISMVKTIEAANRGFQLKTLGFEFISGAVNAFGGNIQVATQAGRYFKAREFAANEAKLVAQRFGSEEEKQIFAELINTFMPLKDDPSYEMYKEAGLSKLTRGSLSDTLMVFMRVPEQLIEKSIFLSLLQNTMVENGKIVSIQEFVKNKYKDRFSSGAAYKQAKSKIDAEIETLKKTRSIDATKKLEEGKLVIPGLDLANRDELNRLTTLTRRISRDATGGMSDGDINKMSTSIWTKSMMVFKGWIPKLLDTRFGEFRKISDDFSVEIGEDGIPMGERYDIGRIRLLGTVLGKGILQGARNVQNIIAMNDAGIEAIDQMFEEFREKYEAETGEPLTISREDFMDLIRTNLRNQIKELTILLSLFGAMMALGFLAPDDDDDDKASKNMHRYAQRVVDKFIGELSFFYNPLEFQKLLSGSTFPAIGLTSDIIRFTKHSMVQMTGVDFDSETSMEEARQKAMPTKYLFKMLPVTKSALTYAAVLSSDFAKEYDVTIQKETSR